MLSPAKQWKSCVEQGFCVDSQSLELLLGRCLCHSSDLPHWSISNAWTWFQILQSQNSLSKGPQTAPSLQSLCLGLQSVFLPKASMDRPRWAPGVWRAVELRRVLRGDAEDWFCYTPPTQPLDGFTQKEELQGQAQLPSWGGGMMSSCL